MIKIRALSRVILGLFFIGAGLCHFFIPGFYLRMMPSFLPYPLTLNYVSGFFESAFGVFTFFSRYRIVARWGLIALLIAVFPANINMAFHPEIFPEFSASALWLRLPLQAVLILWVMFSLPRAATNKESRR